MQQVNLVGISGSLRHGSYNTAILRALTPQMPSGCHLEIASLTEVPLYNEDDDGPDAPAAVMRLRQMVGDCDGLIFCSPEYNGGVPGVLKNAVDWLSRPVHRSSMKGKHALIVSASTSMIGGARMQGQLRNDLSSTGVRVLARPQVVIGLAHEKMCEDQFAHQPTIGFALGAVADLVKEIRIYHAGLASVSDLEEA